MEAVARSAVLRRTADVARRAIVRPEPTPASAHPPLRRCACGGSCPRCRAEPVQRALPINTPGDAYEREADRIATAVMAAAPTSLGRVTSRPTLRRCACGGGCPDCRRRKEEEPLHRLDDGGGGAPGFAPRVVHQVLSSPGRELPAATRVLMEQRFEADFGAVRVHDDARAAESARAVAAHAYTVGSDVVFARGRYAPGTDTGDRLLAHELAHTLQQDGTGPRVQRACGPAAIGVPAGCTPRPAEWLAGYPSYRFRTGCDTFATGEAARLRADAPGLPAAIEVHGYASTSGDATFNMNLSCARALKAQDVLTAPAPTGAGLPAARIVGVFSHGATTGAAAARERVVLSPTTPSPPPAAVPAPGPTDFQIRQVGRSTSRRIYFARGSSTIDPTDAAAAAAITTLRTSPSITVSLIGYASTDEAPAVAQNRAIAIRAALLTAPTSVTVSSAAGNPGATATQSNYTQARSVEIVPAGGTPTTLDCSNPANPPTQACSAMDPPTLNAFNDALAIANNAMSRAVAAVAGAPNATDAPVIDRFFGNHNPGTLTVLRMNLPRLQTNVANLPATTSCGGQCDIGNCEKGTVVAYNNGRVDAAARLTLCVPTFKNLPLLDRARNLIHETAHGTSPLGGAPDTGTADVAYRHERMLFQLSPADRLRNSDSYALFALFLREVQITGHADAVPAGIQTPATDWLLFMGADAPALRVALARLEKRLAWAEGWMGQLYGQLRQVRTGAITWTASWAEDLMRETARLFPLNPPTDPSTTTEVDETRLASIVERYRRMKPAVKRDLIVMRMPSGVVNWTAASGARVAHDYFSVGPDFFRATADDQVSLLLEALARATRDVEPAFVPAYVALAAWIHAQNP